MELATDPTRKTRRITCGRQTTLTSDNGGAQILELGGIEKLWADHKALVAIGRDLLGRY